MAKILIINPFGIGDVLFSTPLVSHIKKRDSKSYIAYICNIRTKEILETNPGIDEVFVFERDEYRALWKKSKAKCLRKLLNFWREIKNRKFDKVIDLSLGREYAFFCWLIGAKERRGFNYKGRGRFLTYKIPLGGFNDKPVTDYYLDLVDSQTGITKLGLILMPDSKDEAYVDRFLDKEGINTQDLLVGIAPGGGAAFGKNKAYCRRWPWQKFTHLIDKIARLNVEPILLWGPGEKDLVENIQREIDKKAILSPETTIREMAALMKRCKLVVCNDGGMLHIAVSQGVETVSVFGPTDERVYGPYPPSERHAVIKSNIDCRPCYKRFKLPKCDTRKCLEDISVEEVFNNVSCKIEGNKRQ